MPKRHKDHSRNDCHIHVTERAYSRPGPCRNVRGLKRIHHNGLIITACLIHRILIEAGRPVIIYKRNEYKYREKTHCLTDLTYI